MSTAEPTGSSGFTYWRLRFRAWRESRPFWAGLFTLLGGLPIAYYPYAKLHLGNLMLAMSTTGGAGSLIIAVLLVTLGLTMWFHSIVRIFAGVAAILLALVSIPVSNLGGYFLGFLLAMLGGALSLSWVPAKWTRPAGPDDTARDAPGLQHPADSLPTGQQDREDSDVTDASAHANGGTNSAG